MARTKQKVDELLGEAVNVSPCPACRYDMTLLRQALQTNNTEVERYVSKRVRLGVAGISISKILAPLVRHIPAEYEKWYNDNRGANVEVYTKVNEAIQFTDNETVKNMWKLAKFRATNTLKQHTAFVRLMEFYLKYLNNEPEIPTSADTASAIAEAKKVAH